MSSRTHNKKRNTKLLYEFLVRYAADKIVSGDDVNASIALEIVKSRFAFGTALNKELAVFNDLMKTTASRGNVVSHALDEAKRRITSIDQAQLDIEKKDLCQEISSKIKDDFFYDRQISEYKNYATFYTLFNAWCHGGSISLISEYTDRAIDFLTSNKVINEDVEMKQEDQKNSGTLRLVMKMMCKKFNDVYGKKLSESQQKIIKNYIVSTISGDQTVINETLSNIRMSAMIEIDRHKGRSDLNEVADQIEQDESGHLDDDYMMRHLIYSEIYDKLQSNGGVL